MTNETLSVSFSTPLPRSLDSHIHVRLTTRDKCIMLFVTSTGSEDSDVLTSLGSFVYAVPDRFKPSEPLCTNIYIDEGSLEFAVRLAKLLVKRTQQPVYVSSSLAMERMGMGGTVEEVLEAYQAIATPLLPLLPKPAQLQNGA